VTLAKALPIFLTTFQLKHHVIFVFFYRKMVFKVAWYAKNRHLKTEKLL